MTACPQSELAMSLQSHKIGCADNLDLFRFQTRSQISIIKPPQVATASCGVSNSIPQSTERKCKIVFIIMWYLAGYMPPRLPTAHIWHDDVCSRPASP